MHLGSWERLHQSARCCTTHQWLCSSRIGSARNALCCLPADWPLGHVSGQRAANPLPCIHVSAPIFVRDDCSVTGSNKLVSVCTVAVFSRSEIPIRRIQGTLAVMDRRKSCMGSTHLPQYPAHWWPILPFFCHPTGRWRRHQLFVDVTEIFTDLPREKRIRMAKFVFYLALMLLAIFRWVGSTTSG